MLKKFIAEITTKIKSRNAASWLSKMPTKERFTSFAQIPGLEFLSKKEKPTAVESKEDEAKLMLWNSLENVTVNPKLAVKNVKESLKILKVKKVKTDATKAVDRRKKLIEQRYKSLKGKTDPADIVLKKIYQKWLGYSLSSSNIFEGLFYYKDEYDSTNVNKKYKKDIDIINDEIKELGFEVVFKHFKTTSKFDEVVSKGLYTHYVTVKLKKITKKKKKTANVSKSLLGKKMNELSEVELKVAKNLRKIYMRLKKNKMPKVEHFKSLLTFKASPYREDDVKEEIKNVKNYLKEINKILKDFGYKANFSSMRASDKGVKDKMFGLWTHYVDVDVVKINSFISI